MRTYWDTSAAINALVSKPVWDKLMTGEHFARTHLLSEFFATMTGRGISVRDKEGNPVRLVMSASDASLWLRAFSAHVQWVELDASETLSGLDNAGANGVMGGRVYDYGHALAAQKANADVLLTRNTEDFMVLSGSVGLEWP